jgi:hypothetical protein
LADFCSARIKSFRYNGQILTEFRVRTSELAPGDELNIIGISSFGEDAEGELYIIDNFDGEVFKIVPDLMMLSSDSIIAGQNVTLTVKDATPGSTVFFGISIRGEGQRFLPRLDVTMALDNPRLLGTDQADGSGTAQLTVFVRPAASGRTLWLQAAENGNTSNVLTDTVQ